MCQTWNTVFNMFGVVQPGKVEVIGKCHVVWELWNERRKRRGRLCRDGCVWWSRSCTPSLLWEGRPRRKRTSRSRPSMEQLLFWLALKTINITCFSLFTIRTNLKQTFIEIRETQYVFFKLPIGFRWFPEDDDSCGVNMSQYRVRLNGIRLWELLDWVS